MSIKELRIATFALLIAFFIVFSYAAREDAIPVMSFNNIGLDIQSFSHSLDTINSIEYIQIINTNNYEAKREICEIHYYYKKDGLLRIDNKSSDSIYIDIYTKTGMYEFYPSANTLYFREKWDDGINIQVPIRDLINDINENGKYEIIKNNKDEEILRVVDEYKGNIYEHKIYLFIRDGIKLPCKEEFLCDGNIEKTIEYMYISINKDIDNNIFKINNNGYKIINKEGIPKLVKDESEAEKYVKFNVIIPQYIPSGFILKDIYIIPPAEYPKASITYYKDDQTINIIEKNIKSNVLSVNENDTKTKAGDINFAISKNQNDICVRWNRNGVEYEIISPQVYKNDIIKVVQSMTGIWIKIDI